MYIAVANLVSFPGHVVLKRSDEAELSRVDFNLNRALKI